MINSQDILNLIEIDQDAKKVFLAMPREEQLLAILGMQSYTRSKLANLENRIITAEEDAIRYRSLREKRELAHDDKLLDTTQKIAAAIQQAFAGRFDAFVYFRDKILPALLIVIMIYLLRNAFAP